FVADFIGETNFLEGAVRDVEQDRVIVDLDHGGAVAAPPASEPALPGDRVTVAVRPEHVRIWVGRDDAGGVRGRVEEIVYRGSDTVVVVRVGAEPLIRARRPHGDAAAAAGSIPCGTDVVLDWDAGAARMLRS